MTCCWVCKKELRQVVGHPAGEPIFCSADCLHEREMKSAEALERMRAALGVSTVEIAVLNEVLHVDTTSINAYRAEVSRLFALWEKDEQRLDWLWLHCEKRYSKLDGRWHVSWVFHPTNDGDGWPDDIRDAIDAAAKSGEVDGS